MRKSSLHRRLVGIVSIVALSVVVLSVASCQKGSRLSPTSGTKSEKIVVSGSSTIAPLVAEIAKRYEILNSNIRIDVQTGGSSRGIADTRKGLSDIGMASRNPMPSENDLHWFPISKDGICLIVHAENPINSLSKQHVRSIYLGMATNWSQFGGESAPITVVNKAEGRSTLEVFLDYFELESSQIEADVIIGDNQHGIKTVSGNPHAIGYVSTGAAEYEVIHGAPIKLVHAGDIPASVDNIRNGTFPISRTLNLITKDSPNGSIKRFIEFCRSDKVYDLIEEQYFVPIAQR